MQHLGADDQLVQAMLDLWKTMSLEERKAMLASTPDTLAQVKRDWWKMMSPEERLQGLTPEELERLRQLLQQPPPSAGDSSSPK